MAAPTNLRREESPCQHGAVHTWHTAPVRCGTLIGPQAEVERTLVGVDASDANDPSRTWREDHHCSATIARTLRASSSDIVVSCFGQSLTEAGENTCSTTVLPTRGVILLTRRPSTQSPGRKCHHRVLANDDHLSGQPERVRPVQVPHVAGSAGAFCAARWIVSSSTTFGSGALISEKCVALLASHM